MWRKPTETRLFVYPGLPLPGTPRWTGGTIDLIDIIIEFVEPAPEKARGLKHVPESEAATNDVAELLRLWALSHEAGFAPAWKMDWIGTEPTPEVNQELYVRYCRVRVRFEVVRSYA